MLHIVELNARFETHQKNLRMSTTHYIETHDRKDFCK